MRLRTVRAIRLGVLTSILCFCLGCAIRERHAVPPSQLRPALAATKEQLLTRYNEFANSVQSINATIDMIPTTGSTYSGVIEQYHDVSGFLLAQRRADIRLIGQLPVVATNLFDMVSNGQTFRIFVPSKNKYIEGPADLERPASNPIENLRPQHLLSAVFWPPVENDTPVLFQEWNEPPERYYLLSVLRKTGEDANGSLELDRNIWFNRVNLAIVRLETYGPDGRLDSDVRYADWQAAADVRFPRNIRIIRPHEDYQLEVHILKLTLNEPISADRFDLPQPPGSELVVVDGTGAGSKE